MSSTVAKKLRPKDLTVDPRVQRHGYVHATLTEMRACWDPAALQTLQVWLQDDGSYVLLDGRHRWKVAQEKEPDEFLLPCQVHRGLTVGEAAALFLKFNNQKPANAVDKFYVRITDEDVAAMTIRDVVQKNGWDIGSGPEEIRAVATLEQVYKAGEAHGQRYAYLPGCGEDVLHSTLYVIAHAWGNDNPKAVAPQVITAVGHFLLGVETYECTRDVDLKINHQRLARNWQDEAKNGPSGWLEAGRGIAAGTGRTLKQVLARELFGHYNAGRGGKKLPDELESFLWAKRGNGTKGE